MDVNSITDIIISLLEYEKDFFKKDSNNEIKSYLFNPEWIIKLKDYLLYNNIIAQYNIKEIDLKDNNNKEIIKKNFASKIKNKIPEDLIKNEVINDIKYEDKKNKKNKKDNFNYYLKCNIINQKYFHFLFNFFKNNKIKIQFRIHNSIYCNNDMIIKINNLTFEFFKKDKKLLFIPKFVVKFAKEEYNYFQLFSYYKSFEEFLTKENIKIETINDNKDINNLIKSEKKIGFIYYINEYKLNFSKIDKNLLPYEINQELIINNLNNENNDMKIKIKYLEDIINKYLSEKELLDNENKELKKQLEENKKIIDKNGNKEQEQLIQIQQLQKTIEKLKQEIYNKNQEINNLKNLNNEINVLKINNKKMEEISKQYLSEKNSVDNENKKLKKLLEENKKIIDKIGNKEQEQLIQIQQLQNNIEKQNQEIYKKNNIINNMQNKDKQQLIQIQHLQNNISDQNQEIQNLKNNQIQKDNQMQKMIQNQNQLENNNKNLQQQINNLNNQIQQMQMNQNQMNQNQMNQNLLNFNEIGHNMLNPNQLNQNFIQNNNMTSVSINSIKKWKMLSQYPIPTKIGLVNIGSTCYMNATLQCFSHTAPLTEYFLDPDHKNIIKNGLFNNNSNNLRLAKEYYKVVINLWSKNGIQYYAPKDFKFVLGSLNKLFEKMEASDAKDMIVFFLEQIHKEINLVKPPDDNQPNFNLNQYNRDQMLQHFVNEFKNTNKSIISDNFFIVTETTQKCQNCKNNNTPNYICYNYNIQNIFIFPLEEVRKYRNTRLMNNNRMMMNMMRIGMGIPMMMQNMDLNDNNEVTIDDCFEFKQKDDLIKIYCNLCKQYSDSIYGNKILSLPNILIMILNRGKDNMYNVILNFPSEINLTNYVINAQEQYIYTIYGVITHKGPSGQSGHFIASCKNPIDGKWYRYNDSIVSEINDFIKEVVQSPTPYILFYERKNNK